MTEETIDLYGYVTRGSQVEKALREKGLLVRKELGTELNDVVRAIAAKGAGHQIHLIGDLVADFNIYTNVKEQLFELGIPTNNYHSEVIPGFENLIPCLKEYGETHPELEIQPSKSSNGKTLIRGVNCREVLDCFNEGFLKREYPDLHLDLDDLLKPPPTEGAWADRAGKRGADERSPG